MGSFAIAQRATGDAEARPGADDHPAIGRRARPPEVDGNGCNCLNRKRWALNSAVECHPHTVEVVGSNPTAPTICIPPGLASKGGCQSNRHLLPGTDESFLPG